MPIDPMAQIKATFFIECEELIAGLADALAVMEAGTPDAETVNIVFRAVHSIKGGAAAFGLEALIAFAHRWETVLHELQAGSLPATPHAVRLFFQAADMLHDHVRAARDAATPPGGSEALLTALEALIGQADAPQEPIRFVPSAIALDFGEEPQDHPALGRAWQVRVTPHAALYHSGNEVLHLLRGLSSLGRATIRCSVPSDLQLTEDSAETPRLGWTVQLDAEIERADIEELFDFVADVCDFSIDQGEAAPDLGPPGQAPTVRLPTLTLVPDSPAPPDLTERTAEPSPVTVRVDLDKIDRLVNLVGELVINQAMLSQSVQRSGLATQEVVSGLDAFMSLTRDIQDSVMSVRAQPVKPLFQRMGRIMREAAVHLGKAVRLRTEGEGTEVDKSVIEGLAEPLTHIIRNAVDHGIETPEERLDAGKPAEGQITLSASHRAGRIVVEVSDDGAGVDRDKVRAAAIARGLIARDAVLSDAEVYNLLFMAGFSTADQVSSVSGRGVGMDVVRSAITAIGGRIAIQSERGRGTTLSISLPLTLAVLDGMVVTAAGQTFVIPLSAILETAQLFPEAIKRVGPRTELLHIRGEVIPLIDLGARLGFRPAEEANRSGIVLLTAQDDGGRVALIIDSIMEQRQVVIKGMGPLFGPMPGVAAATILGDGQIALILDPGDLTQKTRGPAADMALAG